MGLEELLSSLQASEFTDEALPKMCGLNYADFVELVDMVRRGVVFWLTSVAQRNRRAVTPPTNNPAPSPHRVVASVTAAKEMVAEADEDDENEKDDLAELVRDSLDDGTTDA